MSIFFCASSIVNSLYNTIGKTVGQLVTRINADKVKDLMSPAISESSGTMYIFEKDGTVLLAYPETDELQNMIQYDFLKYDFSKHSESFEWEINNTKVFISYRVSDKTGWVYLISVPLNDLLNQTKNIMNTIVLNLIIFYSIIVTIAYFSIKYNRHPLVNIVKTLPTKMVSPEKVMRKGISHISTVVTEIVSDIEQLEERVKEQRNLLQNIILFGLESGEINNENVLRQLASNLGVSFNGKHFRGVYLMIRDNPETCSPGNTPTYHHEIFDFLSSDNKHFPIVSSKEKNLFVMLYQQSLKENEDTYLNVFRNLYQILSNKFGLESVIYLGYPCENVMNVYESFEAAKRLINLNTDTSSNYKFLVECKSSDSGNDYYVYSIKDEQKLMNLILNYDEKGIHCLLADIFRKNFVERSLTNFMRRILFARILGTILSFTELVSLAPELKNSLADIEPRLFFELIEKQCIQICNFLRKKNEENNKRILEQILEYINENICNYELSLNMIAMKFNMSESYLSMCFKEYTGRNFTTYVEELRMNKANLLLDMGKHTIAEIAEKVGYSNPHSFRRAYKRLFGFSPSEYKKWKCKNVQGSTFTS
ncbi:MAG TPA: AraC family transcriptional regulator [Clostridiaceae bacterium]|nr:AraC family transcriptional regulator [Clostridiaceae bacterium]